MEKIKILFYEPSSGFGGSARSLKDILSKLDSNVFHPVVAVLDDGPAIKEIAELGFEVIRLIDKKGKAGPVFTVDLINGYWNYLTFIFKRVLPIGLKLAFLIKKERISLIHINSPIRNGLEAILAARLTGVTAICHPRSTWKWSRIERLAAGTVSKYICLTEEAQKIYEQYVQKDKLVKIYNGIDFEKISSKTGLKDIRKEFGIGANYKIVGIVTRITEGKGIDNFLKAAKALLSKNADIKILVVGDAITEDEVRFKKTLLTLADELGIADDVVFTGWREDALDIISNMDVMVQASTMPEGFGRTCVEAMALSVPLVVTNVPGPSEIVVNEVTGFIVPPGDIEAMARAVLAIITDRALSDKFARNGRKRAEKLYDLNKTVKQIENVYLELAPALSGNK